MSVSDSVVKVVDDVKEWVGRCQKIIEVHHQEKPTLEVQTLKKQFRVVNGKRSAWAFVDFEGNIYKPIDWSKAAKHARGNIYDESKGMSQITPYGPRYLKEGMN